MAQLHLVIGKRLRDGHVFAEAGKSDQQAPLDLRFFAKLTNHDELCVTVGADVIRRFASVTNVTFHDTSRFRLCYMDQLRRQRLIAY